jgi:uncharacterized membrane protein YgcG
MRGFDFSSWQSILFTVIAIAIFALIGVGIRVLAMLTIQQRQQRMNRQINERLRTLIAAYRTLGGSFTGELLVNPGHLRDLRAMAPSAEQGASLPPPGPSSDRPRRIRDAVEAALSDIILLGTEEQVRLAAQAATEMAAGRPIETAALVVSLRDYIRLALDLEPIPKGVRIPLQGPTRPQGGAGRGGKGDSGRDKGGGQGGGGGAAAGGGTGIGMNLGLGGGRSGDPG